MLRKFKKNQNKNQLVPEINLTPLIDTALTLLIIFMLTAPIINNSIKVELPSSKSNESTTNEPQETVISINSAGEYFLNEAKTEFNTLLQNLQNLSLKNPDSIVFINADKNINYGAVIALVDKIKNIGGIKYVALATAADKN